MFSHETEGSVGEELSYLSKCSVCFTVRPQAVFAWAGCRNFVLSLLLSRYQFSTMGNSWVLGFRSLAPPLQCHPISLFGIRRGSSGCGRLLARHAIGVQGGTSKHSRLVGVSV